MRGAIALNLTLVACISVLAASTAYARPLGWEAAPRNEAPPPVFLALGACKTETDLDCVESIDLLERRGISRGTLSASGKAVPLEQTKPGDRDFGLVTGTGVTRIDTWRVPGLEQEYGTEYVRTFIQLVTPGVTYSSQGQVYDWPSGLKIEIVPGLERDGQDEDDMRVACDRGNGQCTKIASFSGDQRIRVVVRTSWLQPAYASTQLRGAKVKIEAMPRGGSRIIASGIPLRSPGFFNGIDWTDDGQPRETFDYDSYPWVVEFIDRADPDFPKDCLAEGFPLISSNAWSRSEPYWDEVRRSLSFQITAPHRDSRDRLFRGFYDARVPGDLAQCLWGKEPRRLASQLTLEILEEDGETQVATSSIGYSGGVVSVQARNFHFSSPTVVLREKRSR